ncbi:Rieske (2Fe-2S) protein [Kitasatospora sp. NPDC049285]|uniref:Rieske (2Fe-2S) protein n=1 Tax=Kitasatospora sp. NPDC049285 TaxID=3157096 RepID=UPI0034294DD2
MSEPVASRRTVLCCAAAVLAGGTAVAGCSSSGGGGGTSQASSPAAGPVDLGAASDVPVGGGKVYRDQKIVVTQPSEGQFKAFSATCTHAGCLVDGVRNSQIQCLCHGSRFGIADGAVQDGPAPKPLPAYQVAVQNGKLQVTKA